MVVQTLNRMILWFTFFGIIKGVEQSLYNPDERSWFPAPRDRQKRQTSHNFTSCVPNISDMEAYYDMSITKETIDEFWVEVDDGEQLSIADESYPKVSLPWNFPFFGRKICCIYPSPKGSISMSEAQDDKQHTFHIAPFFSLYTNDTSNAPPAYFLSSDDMIVVEWRDMYIRNSSGHIDSSPCQFQVHLYKNGTIMFLYKKVPPVIDAVNSFMNGIHGLIKLRFPVCELMNDAQLCESEEVSFYCKNCSITKHCDFDEDKLIQEWLLSHCSDKIPEECNPEDDINKTGISSTLVLILVGVVAVVVWLSAAGGWFYYAYTRPNSPSGRWLIAHRPSQWKSLCLNWKESSNDDEEETTVAS